MNRLTTPKSSSGAVDAPGNQQILTLSHSPSLERRGTGLPSRRTTSYPSKLGDAGKSGSMRGMQASSRYPEHIRSTPRGHAYTRSDNMSPMTPQTVFEDMSDDGVDGYLRPPSGLSNVDTQTLWQQLKHSLSKRRYLLLGLLACVLVACGVLFLPHAIDSRYSNFPHEDGSSFTHNAQHLLSALQHTIGKNSREDLDLTPCKPGRTRENAREEDVYRDSKPHRLFAAVLSTPSRAAYRRVLRQHVYAGWNRDYYAFFIGRAANEDLAREVEAESRKYGDIVLFDFVDSFIKLPTKVAAAYAWIAQYRRDVDMILKIDDDVYGDLNSMVHLLHELKVPYRGAYIGQLINHQTPQRNGKWRISEVDYPYAHYPPHATGAVYALSVDLAVMFASHFDSDFPFEDVSFALTVCRHSRALDPVYVQVDNLLQSTEERPCDRGAIFYHTQRDELSSITVDRNSHFCDLLDALDARSLLGTAHPSLYPSPFSLVYSSSALQIDPYKPLRNQGEWGVPDSVANLLAPCANDCYLLYAVNRDLDITEQWLSLMEGVAVAAALNRTLVVPPLFLPAAAVEAVCQAAAPAPVVKVKQTAAAAASAAASASASASTSFPAEDGSLPAKPQMNGPAGPDFSTLTQPRAIKPHVGLDLVGAEDLGPSHVLADALAKAVEAENVNEEANEAEETEEEDEDEDNHSPKRSHDEGEGQVAESTIGPSPQPVAQQPEVPRPQSAVGRTMKRLPTSRVLLEASSEEIPQVTAKKGSVDSEGQPKRTPPTFCESGLIDTEEVLLLDLLSVHFRVMSMREWADVQYRPQELVQTVELLVKAQDAESPMVRRSIEDQSKVSSKVDESKADNGVKPDQRNPAHELLSLFSARHSADLPVVDSKRGMLSASRVVEALAHLSTQRHLLVSPLLGAYDFPGDQSLFTRLNSVFKQARPATVASEANRFLSETMRFHPYLAVYWAHLVDAPTRRNESAVAIVDSGGSGRAAHQQRVGHHGRCQPGDFTGVVDVPLNACVLDHTSLRSMARQITKAAHALHVTRVFAMTDRREWVMRALKKLLLDDGIAMITYSEQDQRKGVDAASRKHKSHYTWAEGGDSNAADEALRRVFRVMVDQQLCESADYFLAHPQSTMTGMILLDRRGRGKPTHTNFYFGTSSSSSGSRSSP